MLLADYGSDSDSDAGPSSSPPAPAPATSKPAVVKKRKPVKIGLGIDLSKDKDANNADNEKEVDAGADDDAGPRPSKRKAGAGSSALLGMLPPPKRKLPSSGVGASSAAKGKATLPKPGLGALGPRPGLGPAPPDDDDDDDTPALVPKVVKRKAEENLDLFGLSEAVPKPAPKPKLDAKPPTITSAPSVTEFTPPAPTPGDPYPGYYQLPSGSWAAYDPAYYASVVSTFPSANPLAAEESRKAARVGRDWAALDDGRADVLDINASDGLEAAKAERERRERMIKPKNHDEFEYKPIGQTKGLAQDRHQLSSLLHSAYSQREELEARIQENKKNMRNAKTKYGF